MWENVCELGRDSDNFTLNSFELLYSISVLKPKKMRYIILTQDFAKLSDQQYILQERRDEY